MKRCDLHHGLDAEESTNYITQIGLIHGDLCTATDSMRRIKHTRYSIIRYLMIRRWGRKKKREAATKDGNASRIRRRHVIKIISSTMVLRVRLELQELGEFTKNCLCRSIRNRLFSYNVPFLWGGFINISCGWCGWWGWWYGEERLKYVFVLLRKRNAIPPNEKKRAPVWSRRSGKVIFIGIGWEAFKRNARFGFGWQSVFGWVTLNCLLIEIR